MRQKPRVVPMPPGRLDAPLVSMVLTEPPPPEPSMMRTIGSRNSAAMSSAISGLLAMDASAEPPRTVKSSPTTTTGRPSMRPRPNTQLAGVTPFSAPLRVVLADARQCAHLVEAAVVEQPIDALAHRQPAGIVLALDLVGPTHLRGHRLASGQFLEFGLPGHAVLS